MKINGKFNTICYPSLSKRDKSSLVLAFIDASIIPPKITEIQTTYPQSKNTKEQVFRETNMKCEQKA